MAAVSWCCSCASNTAPGIPKHKSDFKVHNDVQPRTCITDPCSKRGTVAQPCILLCNQCQYQCNTRQAASAELEVLQRLQGRVHRLLEQADRLVDVCLCYLRPVTRQVLHYQPAHPKYALSKCSKQAYMAAFALLLTMSLCSHGTMLVTMSCAGPHRERWNQTDDVASAGSDGD